jgi:hypothetical protein
MPTTSVANLKILTRFGNQFGLFVINNDVAHSTSPGSRL